MANILLVYPEQPATFWSFDAALDMIGKQSGFPPLGLLTIAGMFPDEGYSLQMIDMNVESLSDSHIEWADVVLTSSMIIHWASLEDVIGRCNSAGAPIVCGGPLPTQYHEDLKGDAVFFLGEAEGGFLDIVDELIDDPGTFGRRTVDQRGAFDDLRLAPIPRWDLIEFDSYRNMLIQLTRGCPESCTFCNIPFLYGKQTRYKQRSRVAMELDALYETGWRGPVMIVDDNFAGNMAATKDILENEVIPWQDERKFPFTFFTQAAIRISDDPDFLDAMYRAGFEEVFCGIESPVEESLKFMGAQKNLQGDKSLVEKVRTIQRHGMEVQAGFIIGLDTDPDDIAGRMIDFIQEAGIPIAMVGILSVLRDTPDYVRFQRVGRLTHDNEYSYTNQGLFSRTLSFVPSVSPDELFERHKHVVTSINGPKLFFERCATHLRHSGSPVCRTPIRFAEIVAVARSIWRQGVRSDYRWAYWKFLLKTSMQHPTRIPDVITFAIQGHHLITATQEALHVDEVKTFLEIATEGLKRLAAGSLESFHHVEDHANRLMHALQDRLDQSEGLRALQRNADILRTAAEEQVDTIHEEVRQQLREPFRDFERQIEEILLSYRSRQMVSASTEEP